VTITINATILPSAVGTTVNNFGTISYDADGTGTNESSAQTDDPGSPGSSDVTGFAIAAGEPIPALSPLALLMLTAMLAGLAVLVMKRS
jgi:hypothetical protein